MWVDYLGAKGYVAPLSNYWGPAPPPPLAPPPPPPLPKPMSMDLNAQEKAMAVGETEAYRKV